MRRKNQTHAKFLQEQEDMTITDQLGAKERRREWAVHRYARNGEGRSASSKATRV